VAATRPSSEYREVTATGAVTRPAKGVRAMAVLRQVIGDTLRGVRLRQRRTLREVSSSARVSLGYLSEVERGQKEPSSELLAAICAALDVELSELFREVTDALHREEKLVAAGRVATSRSGEARITAAPKTADAGTQVRALATVAA
jgi:transcriptional regulator with XRE-family HTH domain